MTIEEANAAALRASMAGDLEGLRRAIEDRAPAIRDLLREEPSEALASRIRCAIEAGDFIAKDLRVIQGRIAHLRSSLSSGPAEPKITVRG